MSDKNISGTDATEPTDQWLADVYQQQPEEPGAQLDAAVLNLAREHHPSTKKPEAAGSSSPATPPAGSASLRWGRIGGGFAAAAVIVVSISLFLRVDESQLAPEASVEDSAFADLEVASTQVRAEQRAKQLSESSVALEYQADAQRQNSGFAAQARSEVAESESSETAPQAPPSVVKRVSAPLDDVPALASNNASSAAEALQKVVVTGARSSHGPSWQTSAALAPEVTFFFPDMDSTGRAVVVVADQRDGARQVGAYSQDRQEVFVELELFAEPIDIDAVFAQQKKALESQQDTQVAELVSTFLQDRKAQQAAITIGEGEAQLQRRMYLMNTQVAGKTMGLRVTIDPRSPTNHEIVEYLEFN